MVEKSWYKKFGDSSILYYYHILSVKDEQLTALIYKYNQILKQVVDKKEAEYDMKYWMEEEIKNNIHLIPESNVPFLIKF